ncbi:MAG: hypothetical protein WKG01_00705 [Kofleriaceae bacterium]
MVVATRLQERIAAVVATVAFLLVGLLGRGHAAEVAHVEDGKGRLVHAQNDDALAAHDRTSRATHLHEHAAHDDTGACSLLAVVHQAAIAALAPTSIVHAVEHATVLVSARGTVHPSVDYRLAPKTSPPIAG